MPRVSMHTAQTYGLDAHGTNIRVTADRTFAPVLAAYMRAGCLEARIPQMF